MAGGGGARSAREAAALASKKAFPFSAPVAPAGQHRGGEEEAGPRSFLGQPLPPHPPRPGKRQHIEARGSQHQAPGC